MYDLQLECEIFDKPDCPSDPGCVLNGTRFTNLADLVDLRGSEETCIFGTSKMPFCNKPQDKIIPGQELRERPSSLVRKRCHFTTNPGYNDPCTTAQRRPTVQCTSFVRTRCHIVVLLTQWVRDSCHHCCSVANTLAT